MPRVAWAHAWALELCRSTVYDMAQRHALAWHDGCWRMIIILAAATALSANASARRTGADAEPGTHALPTLMRVVAVGRHGVKNPLPADGTFEGIPVSSFFGHGASLPDFGNVEPGQMTPHGLELMALMGAQFKSMYARALSGKPAAHAHVHANAHNRTHATAHARERLNGRSILEPDWHCDRSATVWADPNSRRCADSARAFARGLCGGDARPTPTAATPSNATVDGISAALAVQRLFERNAQAPAFIFRDAPTAQDEERGCGAANAATINALAGGHAGASLAQLFAPLLSRLDEVTGCCGAPLCRAAGMPAACSFASLAASTGSGNLTAAHGHEREGLAPRVNVGADRTWRPLHGPVFAGSWIAEILELMMCNGMPLSFGARASVGPKVGANANTRADTHADIGTGAGAGTDIDTTPRSLSVAEVVRLLRLQRVNMEIGCNIVTARSLGSGLLAAVTAALVRGMIGAEGGVGSPSAVPGLAAAGTAAADSMGVGESTKLVLLFGHDTNMQFLRQLLRLTWHSPGWERNIVEPGALLVFELWGHHGGTFSDKYVQLIKVAASPMQQRNASHSPPSRSALFVPGCEQHGRKLPPRLEPTACPLSVFVRLVGGAIRPNCVDNAGGAKDSTTALRLFAAKLREQSILPHFPHTHAQSKSTALPAVPSKDGKNDHEGSKISTFEYIFVVLFAVVFVWSCRHWYARGDNDIIGGAVGHSVGAVRAAGNSAVELVASAANATPRNAFESMPIA